MNAARSKTKIGRSPLASKHAGAERPGDPDRSAALAREIAVWLQSRGLGAGDHVPEAPLAEAFRVSRTPIRAALSLLAGTGVLSRKANRGYFLAEDPSRLKISQRPREERLREAVLRDRLDRRLESELTATRLMRRYNIGRSVARRILEHLARDGMISRIHGARWHFHPSLDSPASLEQSYRFRVIVEPAAILEPTFSLDPALGKRMRQRIEEELRRLSTGNPSDPGWAARAIDLDIAFHDLLASASANRFFEETIRQQGRLRRLALLAHRLPMPRMTDSMAEHLAILDAAIGAKHALAAELMRKHLMSSQLARPYLANRGAPVLPVGRAGAITRTSHRRAS